jgi:hypothetical protein
MSIEIKKEDGKFVLYDDDLVYARYDTRAEAVAVRDQLREDELISEYVEDAVHELKREIANEFAITMDKAHNFIKEAL